MISVYMSAGTVPDTDDTPVDNDDTDDTPGESGYVGCFADPKDNRSMEKEETSMSMTPEVKACARWVLGQPLHRIEKSLIFSCFDDGAFVLESDKIKC